MTQASLEFLALSIPAAVKVLGTIRTVEHLPDTTRDAVLDLAEAALACYPEVRDAYYARMDDGGMAFNHVAEAYRILVPAVENTTFPLATEYGAMDADTPLIVMVPEAQAMEILDFAATVGAAHDQEIDAVVLLAERLLDRYPEANAAVEQVLYTSGFNYLTEAHTCLTEARKPNRAHLKLVA